MYISSFRICGGPVKVQCTCVSHLRWTRFVSITVHLHLRKNYCLCTVLETKRVHHRCETQGHCTFTGPPQMRNEAMYTVFQKGIHCRTYVFQEGIFRRTRSLNHGKSTCARHCKNKTLGTNPSVVSKIPFLCCPPLLCTGEVRERKKNWNEHRRCARGAIANTAKREKRECNAGESDGLQNLGKWVFFKP